MDERVFFQILEELRSMNEGIRALKEQLIKVGEDTSVLADDTVNTTKICDATQYMAAVIKKEHEEDKERESRQKKLDGLIEERKRDYESLEAKAAIDLV